MTRPSDKTAGIVGIALFLLTTACLGAGPADHVKPLIGTDGHGHVFPGATVPFGMMQLSPDTRDETWDGCSGYHYSDTSILGFSHNHLSGTGCGDLGNVMLMPTVGPLKLTAGSKPGEGYRAAFSHDQEEARPGYYRVTLPDSKINVELTATMRAGLHRYTFPQSDDAHVILDLWHGISNRPTASQITIPDDHTVTGFRRSDGWGGDKVFYFVIEFSRPFDGAGLASDHKPALGKEVTGRNLQAHFDFKTRAGEAILARAALSTVSIEGARKNLRAELPGWDFDAVAAAAWTAWDRALAAAQVESMDQNFKQTFYTAVYHTLVAPTVLSDVDGQVRGPDGRVHTVKGFDYYTELSFWDTFRAEHPLLTLVQPSRVNDFVKTCLAHYRFTSPGARYLPVWANGGKETNCMIGNHSIPVIVDAYLKGFRDWDAGEALGDMIATTNLDREFLDSYRDKGYVVQRKDEQSAAKTLEYCYDDICIARMARAMGKPEVARTYEKRARNWQNVFDRETGFMRSRDDGGAWVRPFDPKRIDMSSYTEANAWHYEFFVPHAVPGLIEKLGGDARFVAKLDEMFDPVQKIPNTLQDITGVIGMYAHGNEPCHHVAYLYNYAGAAWKTQALVRQVADTLYNNTNAGICGNDDCGQTSAWFVFTALGFYPVDPADGVYVIGSPLADRATLTLDPGYYRGGKFTVVAKGNSPRNMYIQSATLNGRPYARSWITHNQIVAGGTLELQMGPNPNKSWGATREDRPGPSGQPSSPAPAAKSQAPATSEKPKYLLFWSSPEKAGELAERVGMKGDGKTRILGFGLPTPTFEIEEQLPERIRSAFAAAREHDMAVMLHFDFHLAWKHRPDLWNWFDPARPGYDPNNKYNVEWHGWAGPPNKVHYLNHGVLERLPPNMCFTSKRTRAEVTRIVSKVIGPVLREEIAKLKGEGKEALFAGVLVGSEPSIDDYSKPNPELAKMMKEDGVAAGPLGYRALLDRGFRADNPPDDFRMALAKIIQETVAFWCEQFVDAGIPPEKLYPHVAAPAPIEMMNAPVWTAFNKYSRPGWTTYAVEVLGENFKAIYDELETHGNPAWAGVEANAGIPGSVVDWETYLAWHYNHGCVLVGVNMGATGTDLPRRLWDSAFGKEAIASYRKFLAGQPLVEKPISRDRPQFRIQAKMKRVRAGIERWNNSGKDPRAVGKLMEGAQPLANAGNLDELEKLVDQALEMLGETEKVPDVYRKE